MLTLKHVSTIATLLALDAAAKTQHGTGMNPCLSKPSQVPQPVGAQAQPGR